MKLTLDKMSRVVVPKILRDRFALKTGDQLEVTVDPDGIHLRPVVPASSVEFSEGLLVCSSEVPSGIWDTGDFIETQRAARARELGGF